jgi:hypothetical protein
MARLTAQLRLPPLPKDAEAIPLQQQLSEAISQQQLDIDFAGPSGLAASGNHAGWGYTTKLVISWSPCPLQREAVLLDLELQSHEAMACGAPTTCSTMGRLLEALEQQLPGLMVLQRSDRDQAPVIKAA